MSENINDIVKRRMQENKRRDAQAVIDEYKRRRAGLPALAKQVADMLRQAGYPEEVTMPGGWSTSARYKLLTERTKDDTVVWYLIEDMFRDTDTFNRLDVNACVTADGRLVHNNHGTFRFIPFDQYLSGIKPPEEGCEDVAHVSAWLVDKMLTSVISELERLAKTK